MSNEEKPLPDLCSEIYAQFLNSAILEDRNELRGIKARIYSMASFVTVSSFAVTAFLLDKGKIPGIAPLIVMDASFIVLLWIVFMRLKLDLNDGRKCLEMREDMLSSLLSGNTPPHNIYPKVEEERNQRISENGLYWLAGLATAAILLKSLATIIVLR